ncbi:hypothetical protein B0T11DRAFT_286124 [Plectosphaerella cucumerina]|uniref:Uncharacterized protein n=1 Tax=Plectosphaerella cucumerina TaxID=40658 RepID=A0A8K0X3A7_9PEZI|nr:hypothetical protein B0T11DRAFT_286124 [Plectosphaerella cucumerina]
MPIRNPFTRRPGPAVVVDADAERTPSHPGFERVDTVGSKVSSLSTVSSKSRDTGDYKMSVVNDSGVYLPPSPTEEKALWPKKYLSSARNSTDTRPSVGDIEHFSISRESFDSYRRSFDISARSPIPNADAPGRQSLDSRFPRLPRGAFDRKAVPDHPPVEESFEDVGLHDEARKDAPRKRGIFSRFGDQSGAENQPPHPSTPTDGGFSRFLPGRKRAPSQSGQGAELNSMRDEGQEMH